MASYQLIWLTRYSMIPGEDQYLAFCSLKCHFSDLWTVTYWAHFCELLTLQFSWNMSAFQLTRALKSFAYLESQFQQHWHFSLRGENFESLPSFSCTYCTFNACESVRLSWVSSGTLCWLNSALFVLLWSWHHIKALHWEDGFWSD